MDYGIRVTIAGIEQTVSHWSGKSFYVAWATLDAWKATTKGLAIFGNLGHTDPIIRSTISMQSMLMLRVWGMSLGRF